jgi:hypothetical protein
MRRSQHALIATVLALAVTRCVALGSPSAAATASPAPVPTITLAPEDAVPDQYVHGQVLTIGHGFLVFTTGDALRLRAGTLAPKGTTTGSLVRATVDQLTREVKLIELEPRIALAGEIDVAQLGKEYVVRSQAAGATSVAASAQAPASNNEQVNVTVTADVPANTPLSDDVYISTERSSFNPSEIRMERVDSRHFTTGLSLPVGTRLRYQFTRGTNATVERERNGDISKNHEFTVSPNAKIEDTVARWADLN